MCGIAGVYGSNLAPELVSMSLYGLQHRGQESAGVAAADGKSVRKVTGQGLVSEVFVLDTFLKLPGQAAIGHVRYSTSGGSSPENEQPLLLETKFGQVALVHNGNLANQGKIRLNLMEQGAILQSRSDSEYLLHLLTRSDASDIETALMKAVSQIRGAFNFILLTADKMLVVMDPHGFRPLVYGTIGDAHVISSETSGLDVMKDQAGNHASFVRDIEPGEVLCFDKHGMRELGRIPTPSETKHCSFEQIYFAKANSRVFGQDVIEIRETLGRLLAIEAPVHADIVVGVPDSGIDAAIGYSRMTGIRLERGLLRNSYMGRTFIVPNANERSAKVRLKLNPVTSKISGKRIVLVDDSIVRGTTSRKIVRMLKSNGAKEIHLRISSPPIIGPCYYGIDTPTRQELIAANNTLEEIAEFLEVDSLAYISLDGLKEALGKGGYGHCFACVNMDYPIPLDTAIPTFDRRKQERRGVV